MPGAVLNDTWPVTCFRSQALSTPQDFLPCLNYIAIACHAGVVQLVPHTQQNRTHTSPFRPRHSNTLNTPSGNCAIQQTLSAQVHMIESEQAIKSCDCLYWHIFPLDGDPPR